MSSAGTSSQRPGSLCGVWVSSVVEQENHVKLEIHSCSAVAGSVCPSELLIEDTGTHVLHGVKSPGTLRAACVDRAEIDHLH